MEVDGMAPWMTLFIHFPLQAGGVFHFYELP